VDPRIRTVVLLAGMFFCLAFGAMTAAVAVESSFDIFSLAAFLIIGMLMLALLGAIRNPPDD
jgi:hypothetical protein